MDMGQDTANLVSHDNIRSGAFRRHLCVLYADLSDSTGLTGELEPEEYREIFEGLNACWDQIIPKHGGVVAQVRGDGIVALFGLASEEDAGRRATEAALELHAAVRAMPVTLPPRFGPHLTLHSGVTAGLVLLVDGDAVKGRHVPIGWATNVACRLSDAAAADEVLVDEACLGADMHLFAIGPRRDLRVKGHDPLLRTRSVLARLSVGRRFDARTRRGYSAMVGRDSVLAALRNAAGACIEAPQPSIALVGPPGIGKTRVMEEFLLEIPDAGRLTLRCHCESYLGSAPLQPVRQVLEALVLMNPRDSIVRNVVTSGEDLGRLTPDESETREAVHEMLQACDDHAHVIDPQRFADVLRRIADGRTVTLLVDDWQWADHATHRVIAPLATLYGCGILVVLASRTAPADHAAHRVLQLEPLSVLECQALIAGLVPDLEPHVARRILAEAGGNPLYVEELCHAAWPQSYRPGSQGPARATGAAPAPLSQLIESRVVALPGDAQAFLRTAAVIGNAGPYWLARTVAALDGLDDVAQWLAAADLLYVDADATSFRFKHGITREVIYETIDLAERRHLHLRCAEAIEAEFGAGAMQTHLEVLAHHYCEARIPERGARLAQEAGERALRAASIDRAQWHFTAALRALDLLPWSDDVYERWMSVAQQLALASLFDANRTDLPVFLRAARIAHERRDQPNEATAHYRLAYVYYALGQPNDAIRHGERALELLPRGEAKTFVQQIEATLAQAHASAGHYHVALDAFERAIRLKRPHVGRLRSPEAFAFTLAAHGMMLAEIGRFDEAFASFDEADELLRDTQHEIRLSATSLRAGAYLWQGRWDAAMDSYERTLALARRSGSMYMNAIATSLGGFATWRATQQESALVAFKRGTGWLMANDQAIWTSLNFGWLAEAMVDVHAYDEARGYAALALRRARVGEPFGASMAQRALARIPTAERGPTPLMRLERARELAALRGSRRELALIEFDAARVLAGLEGARAAMQRLAHCRKEFGEMHMYWYAGRAQELQRHLSVE